MADAFKVGDLVWAKMKSYPHWPARITDPPDHIKPPTSKKGKHCVCFFGTNDFAWIPEGCIFLHSEDVANSTKNKTKTSAALLKAIKEITDYSKGNVDNGTSMDSDSESENENDASSEKSPSSPKRFEKKLTKKRVKKKLIFDQFSSTESIPSSVERENDADVLMSSDNSQGIQEQILTKEKEPKVKKKCNLSLTKSSSNESITASLEGGNSEDLFPSTSDNEKESKDGNEAIKKSASIASSSTTSSSEAESEKTVEIKKSSPKKITKRKISLVEKDKEPFDKTDNGPPKRQFYECPPTPSVEMLKSNYLSAKEIKVTEKKIGFLGINQMSAGVVKNLLLSGHNVTVYDEKLNNCEPFIEAGASIAETADDVVASCDITFGYLADINAVKCMMYSNFGILKGLEGCAHLSKGYVEMTPIDAATALEFDKAFTFYGQRYMIAPVVGSRQSAEEGSLLCLAAGDVELFSDSYSCFSAFSRNVFYVSGDLETGCKMYLIQSMLIGTTTAALAEAMALIKKCDLAFDSFYKLIEMGPFSCQLALEKSCLMNTRNFLPNSDLNHQLLDMKMALKMANSYRQSTVVSAAATELFKRAKFLKYSDHDVSSVVMGTEIEMGNSDVSDSLESD